MATLYFNDTDSGDGDWGNYDENWWTNEAATVGAAGLPTSADSVVLQTSVLTNSGSTPTVVNLEAAGYARLEIQTVVTGTATFKDNAELKAAMTGNCVFQDSALLKSSAEVTGNVTFGGSTQLQGATVHGNATFNDSSQMIDGTVDTGNATFNGSSKYIRPNNSGSLVLAATFNGSSKCCGRTDALATFNGSAVALAGSTDGSEVSDCYLAGNAVFNGTSILNGYAAANVTMRDSSYIYRWGIVNGTATLYNSSYILGQGGPGPKPYLNGVNFYDNSLSMNTADGYGSATYYDNSSHQTNWYSVTPKHGRGINGSSILGFA
jgi:hypothetical protein